MAKCAYFNTPKNGQAREVCVNLAIWYFKELFSLWYHQIFVIRITYAFLLFENGYLFQLTFGLKPYIVWELNMSKDNQIFQNLLKD